MCATCVSSLNYQCYSLPRAISRGVTNASVISPFIPVSPFFPRGVQFLPTIYPTTMISHTAETEAEADHPVAK
jgi:hypothetical protein